MKSLRSYTLLLSVILLAGCEGGLLVGKSEDKPVQGPNEMQMGVDGKIIRNPEAEGNLHSKVSGTWSPEGGQYAGAPAQRDPIPADGNAYTQHLLEVQAAVQTQNPGRLLGIPSGTYYGYPVYPATCTFYPDRSECETSDGQKIAEPDLRLKVTVVRNVDVLNLNCGIDICIDGEGRVLGHVSEEMMDWRDRNCEWLVYGTSACRWAEGGKS